MRRRAFTLVELMVCMGVFSLLAVVALGILVFGARGFHQVIYRQGAQSDIRRIMAALQRDLASTHHRSIALADRESPAGYARDAICMVSLSNWNEPANFDEYLRPRWDSYVIYYATREQEGPNEVGRLIRESVEVTDPTLVGPFEFWDFPGGHLVEGTPLQTTRVSSQVVSDRLWKLELENDLIGQSVSLRVALRNPPQVRATGAEREMHTMEVLLKVKPANTWPQI